MRRMARNLVLTAIFEIRRLPSVLFLESSSAFLYNPFFYNYKKLKPAKMMKYFFLTDIDIKHTKKNKKWHIY